MSTILLTRPQLVAADTVTALEKKGCHVFLAPMLDIKPLTNKKKPDPFDLLFVTSQVVFSVLKEQQQNLDIFRPCYCVGEATAACAQEFGFKNVKIGQDNGKALAHKLATEVPKSAKILYPCALNPQMEGIDFLRQAGYSVEIWPVYRSFPVSRLPQECLKALQDEKIDLALFFSRRTGQTFKKLVKAAGLENTCYTMQALALSPAVAEELSDLPWQKLKIASEPRLASMLDAI